MLYIKKFIVLGIILCLYLQTISPCYAGIPLHSMEDIQANLEAIKSFKSVPASLTFEAHSHQTAAGVCHYAENEGEIYILLGERTTGGLCNFGGGSEIENRFQLEPFLASEKSTSSQGDLADTGAREEREETNKILASHPRLLRNLPFIDVLTEKEKALFLYRMYWKKVGYVDSSFFERSMEGATEAHNKEYTKVKWYQVTALLNACEARNPSLSETETLYAPLFATLCTDSVLIFLRNLTTLKKISPFNKEIQNVQNRLYYLEEQSATTKELKHNATRVFWPLPDGQNFDSLISPAPLLDETVEEERARKSPLREALFQKSLEAKKHFISLNEDAFGRTTTSLEKAKNQFANAIAAHAAFLIKLKEKEVQNTNEQTEDLPPQLDAGSPETPEMKPPLPSSFDPESPDLWESSSENLDRLHLRLVLGPDFKEPLDFEGRDAQERADLANLKEYFGRYEPLSDSNQKITLLESDYKVFAKILAWASESKWPTFYHAANADQQDIWDSFTEIQKFLKLDPLKDRIALRGTDIYFRNHSNMPNILETLGSDDYEGDRHFQVMSFNLVLSANKPTTTSSSCSIGYFGDNHSAKPQDMDYRFQEALTLAGFNDPEYGYFYSLFQQYIAHLNGENENSVLLACTIRPDVLKDYTYVSYGGGKPYEMQVEESPEKNVTTSSLYALYRLQKESERLSKLPTKESFEVQKDHKKSLFPQLRLHIHPRDVTLNSDKIRVKSFPRFEDVKKRENFQNEMTRLTTAFMADWLFQENEILPGSFIENPLIKDLYKRIYKGITGKRAEEKSSFQGAEFLIKHGHLDGVKSFLTSYPEALEKCFKTGEQKKRALTSALLSGNIELTKYLEDIFQTSLPAFFSLETTEFKLLARLLLQEEGNKRNIASFLYLISGFDRLSIPASLKETWASALVSNPTSEAFEALKTFAPEWREKGLDTFIASAFDLPAETVIKNLQPLLDTHIFTPQEVLEKIASFLRETTIKNTSSLIALAESLMSQGATLFTDDPETNEPLIFSFLEEMDFHYKLNTLFEILQTPDQKNGFKRLRNSEGLTVLQAIQKLYVERRISTVVLGYGWSSLYTEEEYKQESYAPFIAFFGVNHSSLINYSTDAINPFLFERNLKWCADLDSFENFEAWKSHILSCPSSALFQLMRPRIEAQDLFRILSSATSSFSSREGNWTTALLTASQNQDEAKVQELLTEAPLSLRKYNVSLENKDLEAKVHAAIDKKLRETEDVSNLWKNKFLEYLQSGNLKKLSQHLSSLPFFIFFEEGSLFLSIIDKLKEYRINFEEIYKSLQKSEEDWTAATLKSLTSSLSPDNFREMLSQAPNEGARHKLFSPLLTDGFVSYLSPYLETVFPTRETLASLDYFPHPTEPRRLLSYFDILVQSPLVGKHLFYYMGASAENVFKTFSEGLMKSVLKLISEDEMEALFSVIPETILLYKERGRDFFKNALEDLPSGPWKKEFCLNNIDRLKEMDPQSNFPYVFYLFFDEDIPLLDSLTERDPTLLTVASKDGLVLRELVSVDSVTPQFKKWIQMKLKRN